MVRMRSAVRIRPAAPKSPVFSRKQDFFFIFWWIKSVGQPYVLQDFLMQVYGGVGVIHLPCRRRWKHVRVIGVLFVFGDQQVNHLLRNRYLFNRNFRLRRESVRSPLWFLTYLLLTEMVLSVMLRSLHSSAVISPLRRPVTNYR